MRFRQLPRLVLAGALLAAGIGPALAAFPDHTVKLVDPYPAGAGTMDLSARTMAEKMTQLLGQPVVVVNQPGAAGTLAAAAVARGPKDGYTVYYGTSSTLGFAKFFYKDLSYDPLKDFTPVALLGTVPVGFFVSADSKLHSVQDLIKEAKAHPGSINFSSPGVGSVTHVAMEMFAADAGIKLKHVPYGSSPNYWADLMSGQLQVAAAGITGGMPLVKQGKLRLLAVATDKRSPIAPDAPALGETVPGYDAPAWLGLAVAKGTPADVVSKLEHAAMTTFSDPAVKERLAKAGIDVSPMGSQAFAAKMAKDMAAWEKTLKNTGVAAAKP